MFANCSVAQFNLPTVGQSLDLAGHGELLSDIFHQIASCVQQLLFDGLPWVSGNAACMCKTQPLGAKPE